jgi:hypothetical protein
MSTLDELKFTVKQRVIDLVSAAGIDVSDWGKFAGGEKRAASNPKYLLRVVVSEAGQHRSAQSLVSILA